MEIKIWKYWSSHSKHCHFKLTNTEYFLTYGLFSSSRLVSSVFWLESIMQSMMDSSQKKHFQNKDRENTFLPSFSVVTLYVFFSSVVCLCLFNQKPFYLLVIFEYVYKFLCHNFKYIILYCIELWYFFITCVGSPDSSLALPCLCPLSGHRYQSFVVHKSLQWAL